MATYVQIWNLPEVLIFKVVAYVAAPTNRATVLCHSIAPLCKAAYEKIIQSQECSTSTSMLWDIVLTEDYGNASFRSDVVGSKRPNNRTSATPRNEQQDRRECKRLRRSAIHRVRDAHRLISDNTEIAYFYLSEMVNCTNNGNNLTKARLLSLLHEYGPNLRFNRPGSSGGLYLVEICRAKNVKEAVILRCTQELVDQWGIQIDLRTCESNISCQTALCVAAARGLHTVVEYLIDRGATLDIISSGRFALHTRPKKTIRCIHQTASEFSVTMRDAERSEGATGASLSGLNKCIKLLTHAEQKVSNVNIHSLAVAVLLFDVSATGFCCGASLVLALSVTTTSCVCARFDLVSPVFSTASDVFVVSSSV